MVDVQTAAVGGRSVQLNSILRAQYAAGKISLPIDGGVYARFKHVQGVPSNGDGGYSLSKLQMIDIMVERLVRLSNREAPAIRTGSESEADAMLESVARDLSIAVHRAETPQGSFAAGLLESGMLFSLVA